MRSRVVFERHFHRAESDATLLGVRIAFQLRSVNRKKTKKFQCYTMRGTMTGWTVHSQHGATPSNQREGRKQKVSKQRPFFEYF